MNENPMDGTKKNRKKRSDAGVPRGPRARVSGDAPISVRLRLIGSDRFIEFGASRREVTPRFHVFFHPSESDRYRETRREYAIDRIEELEITEVPQPVAVPVLGLRPSGQKDVAVPISETPQRTTPQIHNARQSALSIMSRLETSDGPITMTELPGITVGGSSVS